MAIYPVDILNAVKTTLSGSSNLSYVDTFEIQKYSHENMPDFTGYCLVVSLNTANTEFYDIAHRWFVLEVEIVALAKIGSRSETDAMVANSPPTNVGIVTMYQDVFNTLYGNNLGGVLELYPRLDELDGEARFDILEDEMESFIVEARISYRPRGQRWVDLS